MSDRSNDSAAASGDFLDAPLYPHRNWVKAGECGRQPLKDLETWVKGGTFHRYGVKVWDRFDSARDALDAMRDNPAVLEFEGKLGHHGFVQFDVTFRQTGDGGRLGFCGWHFTPEDAAYAALTLIEADEREAYERDLVVGYA